MTLKVAIFPHLSSMGGSESGIKRVIEAYYRYLPQYDVEVVEDGPVDVVNIHAGAANDNTLKKYLGAPIVCSNHGLYWTSDYNAGNWEWEANRNVVNSIRIASAVTVPSRWVQEVFERDMHFSPLILPHGIRANEWDHQQKNQGFVLWNKNRHGDVCDPTPLNMLAQAAPGLQFVSTFAPTNASENIEVIGTIPHEQMKRLVETCGVYLSTTKETFGIGVLEAMAAGKPVLGWAQGGNLDLVVHGQTGYLAQPDNYDDLTAGLFYCLDHRTVLGINARIRAESFTWEATIEKLANLYHQVANPQEPTVSIVIPSYNYGTQEKLGRAIQSALNQDYGRIERIIVIDDGSKDEEATERLVTSYREQDDRVDFFRQSNSGVAVARNRGISRTQSKYVLCLDADDWLEPNYLTTCIAELERDPQLGVAYTGLMAHVPDKRPALSPWPTEWNYDEQLKRHNQIPTACVFRREAWKRAGGFRQRYAPKGAGAEDAEFWTRLGAYGWSAKKVTESGLFHYSWQTGYASGNKDYKEPDWLAFAPWAKDGLHPFASYATPKHSSHPVRQYDEPTISVIIPVGTGHEKEVFNALDSLEAQTFRKWEVIVVDDTDGRNTWEADGADDFKSAYPFVRWVHTGGGRGAGYARNRGAEQARAPFLLFLDADDWLYPQALDTFLLGWQRDQAIVYSHYVGKAYIDAQEAQRLDNAKRLYYYNPDNLEAVIGHKSAAFDCERAIRQPELPNPFVWCLMTSLVPNRWHSEIGGFDENMTSWEDWDYWIRMARAGRCFTLVPEELVVYRFSTGSRREIGLHDHRNLIEYLKRKYAEGTLNMACSSCANKGGPTFSVPQRAVSQTVTTIPGEGMADENYILIEYVSPNIGSHKVVGAQTKQFYGYRKGGGVERFLVHKSDLAAQPHLFRAIQVAPAVEEKAPSPPPPPVAAVQPKAAPVASRPAARPVATPAPVVQEKPARIFKLDLVPGITTEIAHQLQANGIHTLQDLTKVPVNKLMAYKGVGPARAKAILQYASEQIRLETDGEQ